MVEVGGGIDASRIARVSPYARQEIVVVLHGHIDTCAGVAGQIGDAQCADQWSDVISDDFHFKPVLLGLQWSMEGRGEAK